MRLVVVDANGPTGAPLVRQAVESGHAVVAVVHEVDDLPVDDDRVTVAAVDAYAGTGLSEAVSGADAVVQTIEHRTENPDDLLTVAGDNVMDAAAEAGVDRFVTLVSADVRIGETGSSLVDRLERRADAFLDDDAVVADVHRHVERVVRSDFEWTVVRAVELVEEGAGGYDHGSLSVDAEDAVSREDVADFLLTVVEEDKHVRELPVVVGT